MSINSNNISENPNLNYFAMAAILNLSTETKIEIIEKYFGEDFEFDYNDCSDFYRELFKLSMKY